MQLRTNRRPHAPAPSFVSPVKLRTNRRPHASAVVCEPCETAHKMSPNLPFAMVVWEPRASAHNTCWPGYLSSVRRDSACSGRLLIIIHSRTLFPRILNKQKRAIFPISVILTESLPPPPTLLLLGMRTHPVGTRTHRTHANVLCVDRQAGDGVLDVGHCSVIAVCVACPLPCNCRWHAGCMQAPACVAHLHAQKCSLGLHFILARRPHLDLVCQRCHGRLWLCSWLALPLWGVQE